MACWLNVKFAKLCEQCNIKFMAPAARQFSMEIRKPQSAQCAKRSSVIPGSEMLIDIDHARHEAQF